MSFDDCPLFMNKLPDNIQGNNALLALQSMLYEGTSEEISQRLWSSVHEKLEQNQTTNLKELQKSLQEALKHHTKQDSLYINILYDQGRIHYLLENYGSSINCLSQAIEISFKFNIPIDNINQSIYEMISQSYYHVGKYSNSLQAIKKAQPTPTLEKLQSNISLAIERQSRLKKENAKKEHLQFLLSREYKKRNMIIISEEHSRIVLSSHIPMIPIDSYSQQLSNMTWQLIFLYPQYQRFDLLTDISEQSTLLECLELTLSDNTWDINNLYSIPCNISTLSISANEYKWIQINSFVSKPLRELFNHICISLLLPSCHIMFSINPRI